MSSATIKRRLILASIIYGLLLITSVFVIPMSLMMFDAPGAWSCPPTIAAFVAIVLFPLCVIVSQICARVLYYQGKATTALKWNLLPLVDILAIGMIIGVVWRMRDRSLVC